MVVQDALGRAPRLLLLGCRPEPGASSYKDVSLAHVGSQRLARRPSAACPRARYKHDKFEEHPGRILEGLSLTESGTLTGRARGKDENSTPKTRNLATREPCLCLSRINVEITKTAKMTTDKGNGEGNDPQYLPACF